MLLIIKICTKYFRHSVRKIFKEIKDENLESKLIELSDKDRILEIATLISGAKITDESKKVASDLLKGS